mmetsp:Transcript_10203/g.25068  ORF Transcript_10203/g.25068 Transcript_10203/m.25068 type:complete len:309 (-) Transcript_10203:178-1104(-)
MSRSWSPPCPCRTPCPRARSADRSRAAASGRNLFDSDAAATAAAGAAEAGMAGIKEWGAGATVVEAFTEDVEGRAVVLREEAGAEGGTAAWGAAGAGAETLISDTPVLPSSHPCAAGAVSTSVSPAFLATGAGDATSAPVADAVTTSLMEWSEILGTVAATCTGARRASGEGAPAGASGAKATTSPAGDPCALTTPSTPGAGLTPSKPLMMSTSISIAQSSSSSWVIPASAPSSSSSSLSRSWASPVRSGQNTSSARIASSCCSTRLSAGSSEAEARGSSQAPPGAPASARNAAPAAFAAADAASDWL